MSSSDDDRVHAGTLRQFGSWDMLGCVAYREDTRQFCRSGSVTGRAWRPTTTRPAWSWVTRLSRQGAPLDDSRTLVEYFMVRGR